MSGEAELYISKESNRYLISSQGSFLHVIYAVSRDIALEPSVTLIKVVFPLKGVEIADGIRSSGRDVVDLPPVP